MTLELHPEARQEYLASIEWYEKQVEALGAEFSQEIENTFDRILEAPERYRVADSNLRVIKVPRFPFSIIYRWDPDRSHVLVITVFHHKRLPVSWQNRSSRLD